MELVKAVKWSFFSELAAKAIQPVVFIVLARLLTPEDFGVMAAALMVIGFSQIFWEAGMGKAIIQRRTEIIDAANAAFWINVALGIVISIVLFSSAGFVAEFFFHDTRVTVVLRVMTLQIFLGAFSAIHIALLQKEMRFERLFWIRFATVSLPGLASIPLALLGMDYWALVIGALFGQFVQVLMLWRVSTWRPTLTFRVDVAKQIGRFGAWVALSGVLAWFYVWADSLVVGAFLGSHELGLYRTGNQLAVMVFAILFAPIVPVFYSHLSRISRDDVRMRGTITKVIRALAITAIPIAIMIFSLATPIGDALFGAKWSGIGFVIGLMALMHGYSWVVGLNGEVYRAMGKPNYETIVTAAMLLVYLAAYLISIRSGLVSFVWTRLGLALFAMVLHLLVLRKLLSVSIFPIFRFVLLITIVCGLLVYLVNSLMTSSIEGSWSQLLIGGAAQFAVVATALFIIGKNSVIKDLWSFVRGRPL